MNFHGVGQPPVRAAVTYVHFLLEKLEIVFANGMAVESLHPSPNGIAAMNFKQRKSLLKSIPHLASIWNDRSKVAKVYGPTARPILTGCDTRHDILVSPFDTDRLLSA